MMLEVRIEFFSSAFRTIPDDALKQAKKLAAKQTAKGWFNF